ncbi:MAG: dipeptide ABC transporter ATP-binding protein [Acidimicrobiales bacterium]
MTAYQTREGCRSELDATTPNSHAGTSSLLEVSNLRVTFGAGRTAVRAVDGVSFDVSSGQTVGIVGESGSGKSVAMMSLLRLLRGASSCEVSGHARLMGTELLSASERVLRRIRGRQVGMVFQNPTTSLNPVFRVGALMSEAITVHRPELSKADVRSAVIELLRVMMLPDPERQYEQFPHELSGGMAQRVMIAMAIANSPALIIADEPTTGLDVTVQAEVLRALREGQRRVNAALILISHNLAVVSDLADEILVMYAGRVVEQGPTREVLRRPQHPYTQALLRAVPNRDTRRGTLRPIPGNAPTPPDLPTGCSFHSRCSLSRDRSLCRETVPQLVAIASAPGRLAACHFSSESAASDPHQLAGDPAGLGGTDLPRTAQAVILRCEGLTKDFDIRTGLALRTTGHVRALNSVSLELFRGETLAVVGESGSGKSTLARIVMGLTAPTSGTVTTWDGTTEVTLHDIRRFTRHVQIVLQDPYSSLNPRASVRALLAEPLKIHGVSRGPAREARVQDLLQLVGLNPSYAARYPGQLSGGQRQRVGIARSLALDPKVLVLDEPTSALDVSIQSQILNLLLDLQQRLQLSMLFISHDLSVVRYVADRVAVMYSGEIVEIGEVGPVCDTPQHPYTQRLLAAVPEIQFEDQGRADPEVRQAT